MKPQDLIYIPDGYLADGTARPWREATVLEVRHSATPGMSDMLHYEAVDNAERGWVPAHAVRTIRPTTPNG